jgi:hypothetical protein
MFAEITQLLGIERVIWPIRAFAPLPAFRQHSDVITAYAICFNNDEAADLWGVREWEFFLDDLVTHLAPDGSIWLQFNGSSM